MSSDTVSQCRKHLLSAIRVVRRDEVVGILLALFLGAFGIHHFYLRRTGLGILYSCFFWTRIPSVLGFIECFFMPGRVSASSTRSRRRASRLRWAFRCRAWASR